MNLPVLCRAAVFAGWMLDKEFSHDYTIDRRGADCKGQLSIPFVKKIDRTVWKQGGQSFFVIILPYSTTHYNTPYCKPCCNFIVDRLPSAALYSGTDAL